MSGTCVVVQMFAEDTAFTIPNVVIDTPIFSFSIDIPHTYSRRLDVWLGLRRSIAQLEGTVDGMLGHTIRGSHPLNATSMEQVSAC